MALKRSSFIRRGRAMGKKNVSHYVTRPGKQLVDPPITIPVAEDLLSVPGIPTRDGDVALFAREDRLENMAVAESASAHCERLLRSSYSTESHEFDEEHVHVMEPNLEAC